MENLFWIFLRQTHLERLLVFVLRGGGDKLVITEKLSSYIGELKVEAGFVCISHEERER